MKAAATAVLLAAGASNWADALRVSPELDPKSHKTFFGKDYPDDLRPSVKDHFDTPFPIVQESHDYDKDFVKDENKDHGEWLAQETYDKLRTKLSNLKSDATAAEKKEAETEDAYTKAEAELKAAEEKAKAAGEAADKHEKEHQAKKAQLEEHAKHASNKTDAGADGADGADGANGTDADGKDAAAASATGNASAEVTKDEMNLDDCLKQLEEAKAKLAKLAEEKKAREAEHEAALANETKAAEDQALSAKEAAELAEKRRLAEEEHSKSLKSVEQEQKELEQLESDLKKKADHLRSYREKAMGKSDGLYHDDKHSGASKAAPLLIVGLFAFCLS